MDTEMSTNVETSDGSLTSTVIVLTVTLLMVITLSVVVVYRIYCYGRPGVTFLKQTIPTAQTRPTEMTSCKQAVKVKSMRIRRSRWDLTAKPHAARFSKARRFDFKWHATQQSDAQRNEEETKFITSHFNESHPDVHQLQEYEDRIWYDDEGKCKTSSQEQARDIGREPTERETSSSRRVIYIKTLFSDTKETVQKEIRPSLSPISREQNECKLYEEKRTAFRRGQLVHQKLLTAPTKRPIEALEAIAEEPVHKEKNVVMTAEEEPPKRQIDWNKVFRHLADHMSLPNDYRSFFIELFNVENSSNIIQEVSSRHPLNIKSAIIDLFLCWTQTAGNRNFEEEIEKAFKTLNWMLDLAMFQKYMRNPPLLEGQNIEMRYCQDNFPDCTYGYALPLPKNSNDRETEHFDTQIEHTVTQSAANSELFEERSMHRVIKYSRISGPRKRKSFQEDILPISHSRNKYRKVTTSREDCSKTGNRSRQNINSRLAKHLSQNGNQTSIKSNKRGIVKIERNEQQPSEECKKRPVLKVKRKSSPLINQGVFNEDESDTKKTIERRPEKLSGTSKTKYLASVVSSGCSSDDLGTSSCNSTSSAVSGIHYPYRLSSVSSASSSTFHSTQNLADLGGCRSTQSWTVNPTIDSKRLFKRGLKTPFKKRQKRKDKGSTCISFHIPSKHRKNRRKCRGKCQTKHDIDTLHLIEELIRYNPNLSRTSYEIFLNTLLKQLTKPYQSRKLILKVKMHDLQQMVAGFFLSFGNSVIVFNKEEWKAIQLYLKARPKSEVDNLFVTCTGDPVTEI